MDITEETDFDKSEQALINDQTGFDEVDKAIEKLKKLSESRAETPEVEEEEPKKEILDDISPSVTPQKEEKQVHTSTAEKAIDEKDSSTEEEEEEDILAKKEKLQKKVWQETKSKFAAIRAKEEALKKYAELEAKYNELLNSGTYHYTKSTLAELERAKENKKRAIEEGNVDALIEADLAINKISHTINEIDKWSYNNTPRDNTPKATDNQYPPQQFNPRQEFNSPQQQELNAMEQEIAAGWLENHTYLQPNSKDYNAPLANKVIDFSNYLNDYLVKNGQQDLYFSDKYFDALDNFITDAKKEIPKKNIIRKDESDSHIGGVRNSYSTKAAKSLPQITLTPEERKLCVHMGVTEEDWLKYKIEELQGKKGE